MEIIEIYNALRRRNLVADQYDFSENWLGRCRSYFSAIQSLKRPPSVKVLMVLKLHLESTRNTFKEGTAFGIYSKPNKQTLTFLDASISTLKHELQRNCIDAPNNTAINLERASNAFEDTASPILIVR